MIGPENLRRPLNQSDVKLKKNCDFFIRVFPRFKQFAYFDYDLSLAYDDVNLFLIGRWENCSMFLETNTKLTQKQDPRNISSIWAVLFLLWLLFILQQKSTIC